MTDEDAERVSRMAWDTYSAGSDYTTYRYAALWCRKYADLYGVSVDPDWPADAVCDAYVRYCKWRRDNAPDDPARCIRASIRRACRGRVTSVLRSRQRKPETIVENLDEHVAPEVKHDLSDFDLSRLSRVLGRLPAHLTQVAIVLLGSTGAHTLRSMAEALACAPNTVRARLSELKMHPAIQDLAWARQIEAIAP